MISQLCKMFQTFFYLLSCFISNIQSKIFDELGTLRPGLELYSRLLSSKFLSFKIIGQQSEHVRPERVSGYIYFQHGKCRLVLKVYKSELCWEYYINYGYVKSYFSLNLVPSRSRITDLNDKFKKKCFESSEPPELASQNMSDALIVSDNSV